MKVTIYHNPRCSKSRQTLELLINQGIEPVVVEYLKTPPDRNALKKILKLLNMEPRELMRTKEPVYRQAGLNSKHLNEEQLLDALIANPVLMERPIVLANGKAAIGRPPEAVLAIL